MIFQSMKKTAARALLFLTTLALTLIFLEFVLFAVCLPYIPLKLHLYLDDRIRILAQSSKRAAVPRDYVAIAGDSYAQGRGDWLLSVNANRNPAFHSAHVMHERTGHDVISFARGGAGSVRGVIKEPLSTLHLLQTPRRFRLEPPKDLLIYFCEGNDLQDTRLELMLLFAYPAKLAPGLEGLRQLSEETEDNDYFRSVLDYPKLYDPGHFQTVVQDYLLRTQPLARDMRHISEHFFFARFVGAAIAGEYRRHWKGETLKGEDVLWPLSPPRAPLRARNIIRVNGRDEMVLRELQGPAPELSDEETSAALYAFEQSLLFLGKELPNSRLCVVYIPSPATSYELGGDQVILQPLGKRQNVYSLRAVLERSRELRGRVRAIARRSHIAFVDATDEVRKGTATQTLHGPRDWRHFNRQGYVVLAAVAVKCLSGEDANNLDRAN